MPAPSPSADALRDPRRARRPLMVIDANLPRYRVHECGLAHPSRVMVHDVSAFHRQTRCGLSRSTWLAGRIRSAERNAAASLALSRGSCSIVLAGDPKSGAPGGQTALTAGTSTQARSALLRVTPSIKHIRKRPSESVATSSSPGTGRPRILRYTEANRLTNVVFHPSISPADGPGAPHARGVDRLTCGAARSARPGARATAARDAPGPSRGISQIHRVESGSCSLLPVRPAR